MTIAEFFKFKNYKTNSVLVVVLFVLAFACGRLSGYFRYTGYRWVFQILSPLSFVFSIAALLSSFANTLHILREVSPKDKKKYYWLAVGSIPLLCFIVVIIHISTL